jgi:hypothetical protein
MDVFVLVRPTSATSGHGQSDELLAVAGPSVYGGEVYPVFLSAEEAVEYVGKLENSFRIEILRLETPKG